LRHHVFFRYFFAIKPNSRVSYGFPEVPTKARVFVFAPVMVDKPTVVAYFKPKFHIFTYSFPYSHEVTIGLGLEISHINPIHIRTPYFFNNFSRIILQSTPSSPALCLPLSYTNYSFIYFQYSVY